MGGRNGDRTAADILKVLVTSPRPLGAYDLMSKVTPRGIASPPTVYRALKRLISDGKVHRIESLNSFVACRHARDAQRGSVHERGVGFAICDRCGSVDEFVDPVVGERLDADLSARAFLPRALAIEVRGLCAICQLDEESAPA